jgi:hypothetical protein
MFKTRYFSTTRSLQNSPTPGFIPVFRRSPCCSSLDVVQALKLTYIEITILVQTNSSLSSVQLTNVVNQLNTTFFIMGDITSYRILKQQRQTTWRLSLPGRMVLCLFFIKSVAYCSVLNNTYNSILRNVELFQ